MGKFNPNARIWITHPWMVYIIRDGISIQAPALERNNFPITGIMGNF